MQGIVFGPGDTDTHTIVVNTVQLSKIKKWETVIEQNKHCQSYTGLGEQAAHKDINFVA